MKPALKKLTSVFYLLILFSCSKNENINKKTFDVGDIRFEYSSEWNLVQKPGIDTYFSELISKGDTIFIQYGMYNPKIYNNPLRDHLFAQLKVDNREIVIEKPKQNYGYAGIYIPKVDSLPGFFMFSTKTYRVPEILDIYSTIKLGKSQRKHRIPLSKIQFTGKDNPTGIMIYENNCLSCHSEFNTILGPPIHPTLYRHKGRKWFEKYLYSEKFRPDPRIDLKCTKFEQKDSVMVKQLSDYLFD